MLKGDTFYKPGFRLLKDQQPAPTRRSQKETHLPTPNVSSGSCIHFGKPKQQGGIGPFEDVLLCVLAGCF